MSEKSSNTEQYLYVLKKETTRKVYLDRYVNGNFKRKTEVIITKKDDKNSDNINHLIVKFEFNPPPVEI